MELEELIKTMSASSEVKGNVKFETNRSGTNVTTHTYMGADKKQLNDLLEMAVQQHKNALEKATKFPVVTSV